MNINIGMVNVRTIEAMYAACEKSNELNHAVLLDTVGAGASKLRTDTALGLIEKIHFDVIRGNIYHEPSIVVDTHVKRISKKLGLSKSDDMVVVEQELMKVLPQEQWIL